MPADLLMIAVDWYGPFSSLASARAKGIETGVGDFLYFGASNDSPDSYVGLSSNIAARLAETHPILGGLEEGSTSLWLGIVSSQSVAGRKPANGYVSHSEVLHVAEHMIAYFLRTSMNRQKRRNKPSRSAVIFNRWFRPESPYARYKHRPHPRPNWPDIIEYESTEDFARNVWFGGEIKKFIGQEIEELKRTD